MQLTLTEAIASVIQANAVHGYNFGFPEVERRLAWKYVNGTLGKLYIRYVREAIQGISDAVTDYD